MCWCPRGRLGKPGRVLSGMCLREVAWAGVRSVGQGSALLPRCGGWGAHAEPLSERCGFGRALSAFVIKLNGLLVAWIRIGIDLLTVEPGVVLFPCNIRSKPIQLLNVFLACVLLLF